MTNHKTNDLYRTELFSGILLITSFFIAIIMSNAPFTENIYKNFIYFSMTVENDYLYQNISLKKLVNDGLMSLFFLLISLELKYHLVLGEFKEPKKLILPSAAAIGGIVCPIAIFLYFNYDDPYTFRGWAIPIATDTAFMLGVLSFFHKIVTPSLRAFIIGFSLIDDAIALMIIAFWYSQTTNLLALMICFLLIGCLILLNKLNVLSSRYYLIVGFLLWIAMVYADIHGTLAGVVIALAIPLQHEEKVNRSFFDLEEALKPVVYFFILPLFSFINSGIDLHDISVDLIKSNLCVGIFFGLFIGKQLGIYIFSYLVVKLKYCTLPQDVSWLKFYSIAVLGGIGFTLSLFIGDLSFPAGIFNEEMRLGVILGSLSSTLLGLILLFFLSRPTILKVAN